MSYIQVHADHCVRSFLKRTVSAQLHLIATIMASIGLIFLLKSCSHDGFYQILACAAFGTTSVIIFATSTVYHFLSDGFIISPKLNLRLENLDHFAIYLFIAGSYSPFLLNAIQPPWKSILLISIWSLAFLGIFYTHFKPKLPAWARHRLLYTSIFICMGWVLISRIGEVAHTLSMGKLLLLVGGGLSYTVGAIVYATRRPKLFPGLFGFHELWHVMVILGFGLHYFMILAFYR